MIRWAMVAVAVGGCQFDRPTNIGSMDAPGGCAVPGPSAAECPTSAPVCSSAGLCTGCATNNECADRPLTPVCLGEPAGGCVACDDEGRQATEPGSASDHCQVPGAQVCDAIDHTCRPCLDDVECASGVCDAGTCADRERVLRVATTGVDGPACGTTAPCATLRGAVAVADGLRRYIVISPGTYIDSTEVDIADLTLTVVAHGATLRRSGTGAVLTIRGTSDVTLVGGTIDAAGADNDAVSTTAGTRVVIDGTSVRSAAQNGILASGTLNVRQASVEGCGGWGILANSSGSFELTRSTLIRNGLGAVSLSARDAVIVNNVLVKNGSASTLPALQINSLTNPGTSRIEFNTIAGNVADLSSVAGAASCASPSVVLRNSILYGNLGAQEVVGCTVRYATIEGAPTDVASGIIDIAPGFVNTAADDFHLTSTSLMRGRADPVSDLTGPAAIDIDEQVRPAGGTTADLGADEIP